MTRAIESIANLIDRDTFERVDDDLETRDPLSFAEYGSALERARAATGVDEAVVAGRACIGDVEVEIASFDFPFLGGSMGEVVGERVARTMERAAERGVPFVLRTATGGARMQEGMRSLIQMPKLVAQRIDLAAAHQPFIAVLGNPTTGGVFASIASLADVTVAEAGATIGFAGPRVAERFTGKPLPEASHTATAAYGAGLVDEVVSSSDAHAYVASVLNVLASDDPIEVAQPAAEEPTDEDPWDLVEAVRGPNHPNAPDLLRDTCDSYIELRGDRSGTDDPAVVALLARIGGRRVVALALARERHPGPGAYRKARRCVEVATRLNVPVVTLVDTRGADPSAESEAAGIASEIARLFDAMLRAPVPIVSLVTGEGGSGGALAFAAGDRLVAFGRSIFSVIGPEGAAEILWRDATKAPDAARALRLSGTDLFELGIADEVVRGTASPEMVKFVTATTLASTTWDGDVAGRRRERWRDRSS